MNTARLPHPYAQLLAALVLQLLMLGLEPSRWIQQPLNLVFTLWIASAAASIVESRRTFLVALTLGAAPAAIEMLVPASGAALPLTLFQDSLWIAFPVYLAGSLVVHLFSRDEVTLHEISGAVALYLLIGLAFANAFLLVESLAPGSVVFEYSAQGSAPEFVDFLYFSFATLTTTGYGDAAPVHHVARILAMAEALAGLMYLSVLVARAVSLHAARRG